MVFRKAFLDTMKRMHLLEVLQHGILFYSYLGLYLG